MDKRMKPAAAASSEPSGLYTKAFTAEVVNTSPAAKYAVIYCKSVATTCVFSSVTYCYGICVCVVTGEDDENANDAAKHVCNRPPGIIGVGQFDIGNDGGYEGYEPCEL